MQNFNLGFLFLASDGLFIGVVAGLVVLAIVAGILSWILSARSLKKKYEKEARDIETQRNRMLDDVREESRAIKKEAILEAKEQEIKLRNDFERESKEKRVELQRLENRLNQKEESLEKKEENLAKRNEETTRQQNALKAKEIELENKIDEINAQHHKMIEEFEKIRSNDFYFIDKSGLIKDLLNSWGEVNLFTRPRRFGKSLNMSMLRHFFEIGCKKELFRGLMITEETELCEEYMGKFPVISVSLKGVLLSSDSESPEK